MEHLALVRCPNCGGSGRILFHKHLLSTRQVHDVQCSFCAGTGQVRSYIVEKWRDIQRAYRLSHGLTIPQEAKRLGITPEELDQRENGRVK